MGVTGLDEEDCKTRSCLGRYGNMLLEGSSWPYVIFEAFQVASDEWKSFSICLPLGELCPLYPMSEARRCIVRGRCKHRPDLEHA